METKIFGDIYKKKGKGDEIFLTFSDLPILLSIRVDRSTRHGWRRLCKQRSSRFRHVKFEDHFSQTNIDDEFESDLIDLQQL